jgi:hypothetical protein
MRRIDDDERACKGDLILMSYDNLADGGRKPYRPKRIDKDTEEALKRLFAYWPTERRSLS